MANDNGFFKGTTKQAIADLKEDFGKLEKKMDVVNNRTILIIIIISILFAERANQFIGIALASLP